MKTQVQASTIGLVTSILSLILLTRCGSDASFENSEAPKRAAPIRDDNAITTNPVDADASPVKGDTTATTSISETKNPDGEASVVTPTPAPTSTGVPTPLPIAIPTVIPTSTAAPDCTTPPVTVVTLMSTTFTNNALNQFIQYKLSQTDCHGTPIPIVVDEIRFDVNARNVSGRTDVPFKAYLVNDPTNAIASGTLQVVTGKDMFGVVDSGRFYYSTTNQITIPASTYEIYFSIDYSCTIIHPIGATGKPPKMETIDSYLAFGGAIPVTQPIQVSNSQVSGACR